MRNIIETFAAMGTVLAVATASPAFADDTKVDIAGLEQTPGVDDFENRLRAAGLQYGDTITEEMLEKHLIGRDRNASKEVPPVEGTSLYKLQNDCEGVVAADAILATSGLLGRAGMKDPTTLVDPHALQEGDYIWSSVRMHRKTLPGELAFVCIYEDGTVQGDNAPWGAQYHHTGNDSYRGGKVQCDKAKPGETFVYEVRYRPEGGEWSVNGRDLFTRASEPTGR